MVFINPTVYCNNRDLLDRLDEIIGINKKSAQSIIS